MMTMSKALGAAQAKAYYGSEYTNGRENYYAEHDTVAGEWRGQLADEFGLEGEVQKEQFERLIDGQDPHTGEQLVRHVAAKEYENEFGEKIKTSEHRAGWDATFSAPKTVSIAALIGKDERIREAHREAVDLSLQALEKYTQARLGGNTPAEMSSKFAAAKFEHTAARPDKETGYAAPQLHTHVIIFNLTKTQDGETKPVQERELFRSQQYATAIYRTKLAEGLQNLGYEVEVDRRTGAPEIKGFSAEYTAANSPRREEVKRIASEMKERLAEAGITVKDGAGLNQAAAKTNRQSKRFDRSEMQQRHQEMDAMHGHQARQITANAIERGAIAQTPEDVQRRAQESVTFARDHAMEREAVADMRKVTTDALRRNLGLTTYDAVQQELAAREWRGELVGIVKEHQPRQTTTREMLSLERGNIARILAEQGKVEPLCHSEEKARLIGAATANHHVRLNESQRVAIETILTSQDRIIGLQGYAGTGKTTTLAVLKTAAEGSGYEVRGYAPTTKAAKQLSESSIETVTLQKFLRSRSHVNTASDNHEKRLYVLDESSLASTRNIHRFFERVGQTDKILLVGDSRQHQAVEAGSPFEQFQKHGMATAQLTEIIRQKDETLKQVVERLSAKEVLAAVKQLEGQGRVIEVADDPKCEHPDRPRLEAIAKDYVEQPNGTLVISPANSERVAINMMIHQQLQEKGVVDEKHYSTKVYVNRQDMTGAERTFAGAYAPGEDIIHYNTSSRVYGVNAGEYGRVKANDYAQNTITVQLESGREITYNPKRLSGVNVYREQAREFSEGDRLQFRAPLTTQNGQQVANGEIGTIQKVEGTRFTLALESGRHVEFDTDKFRHIDHGYAVTSYLSQGETVERVIINADTRQSDAVLNQRMSYVAISRAKSDAKIYTNSNKDLGKALDRAVSKEMALEAVASQHEKASETEEHKHNGDGRERMWMPVTAQDPCPVCRKPDYCSVVITETSPLQVHDAEESSKKERHVDIFCRRVESDQPGHGGWYHPLPEGEDASRYEGIEKTSQNQIASLEQRDAVNRRMNQLLMLSDRDRANLRERGLDDATIAKYDYRSVPTKTEAARVVKQLLKEGYDLKNVPGFYRPEADTDDWQMRVNGWYAGFMVGALNVDGKNQGQQIRRAEVKPLIDPNTGRIKVDPVTGEEKREARYVWFSSPNKPGTSKTEAVMRHDGASSGSPVHYRNPDIMRASGEAILTEGVLKADCIAHYLDRGVIGVAGVGNFPKEFGKELREKIPELKRVFIAYDADAMRNPQVQLHLDKLRENLQRAGLDVNVLKWEEQQGKGLDDYLKNTLTKHFHLIQGEKRAEWQQQALSEVGWSESRQATAAHDVGIEKTHESESEWEVAKEAVKKEAERTAAVTAYERHLQEIERGITLGDELFDRWQVQHYMVQIKEGEEQRRVRRHEVIDQSTGLQREMSIHDVEQRALAVSQRLTDEQNPANAKERDLIQQAMFAQEMNRHQQTLQCIAHAHSQELRYHEQRLSTAIAAHNRSAPVANEVVELYRTQGRDVPMPIIAPEKLDELHEQAAMRRDVAQLTKLEEIRCALPVEFGETIRDDYTAGRLEGQLFMAHNNQEVAEKRAEDFERTNYFRRWEIGGSGWSRFEVERQLARAEKSLNFHQARELSYAEQSKFKLQNIPHLLERGEYRLKAESASREAAEARSEVERLRPVHQEVLKSIEAERTRLSESVQGERAFTDVLSTIANGERERRVSAGLEAVQPVLTKSELRRLETSANVLHDANLIHRYENLNTQRSANLTPEKAATDLNYNAGRAFAREQVAGIVLDESINRLTVFEERRLDMPLLYKDASGEQKIGRLREVEPKTLIERWMRRFTERQADKERREAIQFAATERHGQLVKDREQAGAMYVAARDITDSYIERLHAQNQGKELPKPNYTAKEIVQIETHGAKQTEVMRAFYQELVSTAITEGRGGSSKSEKSNQTQTEHTKQPQVSHKSEQTNAHTVEARTPVVLQDQDQRTSDRSRKVEGSNHRQDISW